MERIKEALERARRERESAQGGDGTPARHGAGVAAPRDVPAGDDSAPITYTQTRSAPMDPRVARANRLVTGIDNREAIAAYKILRTQVLQRMRSEGWNALAVTSPGTGEGKTLTAVNLALSIAQEVNHTVLLVDMDLRRPSVHRLFGVQPERGINDHLVHDVPVHEILFNPGAERLVVLPGREPILNSSEVLSSPKMVRLVEELKHRYPSRIVVFDLPPVLSADDAMAFAPYIDCALLVIEEGSTRREAVTHAMEYLAATRVLGTVLNKAERSMQQAHAYY